MEQKKTILIAVIINAAVLVVLFVLALTTDEEYPQESMVRGPLTESSTLNENIAQLSYTKSLPVDTKKNLEIPTIAKVEEAPSKEVASAQIPLSASPPKVEIAHKLPPMVGQTPTVQTKPVTMIASTPPVESKNSSHAEVVVKKGDSLDKIAKAHKTTVEEIVKLNQLPGSFLKIGQVLKIPDPKTTAIAKSKPVIEKTTTAGPEYYVVKVGDNPWSIANKNHMKVDELLKLNQLNEEKARKLKPGDRLRIR